MAWKKPSTALTQLPKSSSHDTLANPDDMASHSSGCHGNVILMESQRRVLYISNVLLLEEQDELSLIFLLYMGQNCDIHGKMCIFLWLLFLWLLFCGC